MREVKIYTVVVPYDFDLEPLTKLLPNRAVWHEARAIYDQLHSRSFWEYFTQNLAKELFNTYTE